MALDVMKDHLIPHTSEKKIVKEMFYSLASLHHSENNNRKMIIWSKIRSIEITKLDPIISHLLKIMQIHEQVATI